MGDRGFAARRAAGRGGLFGGLGGGLLGILLGVLLVGGIAVREQYAIRS